MPNWVYNGLTIEGNPDQVKSLITQMNKPFVMVHDNWNVATQQMEVKQTTYYEEETGWGGEMEFLRGEIISESEYDNMCRECDKTDCMEWCEECEDEVCIKCQYNMVESCSTHGKVDND